MVFVALMLKISICNILTVKEISVKVDATFYEIKKMTPKLDATFCLLAYIEIIRSCKSLLQRWSYLGSVRIRNCGLLGLLLQGDSGQPC